jgi:hypothetical protein
MPRRRSVLSLSPEILAARRQYNREYMRRWRSDIRNYEKEQESRERAHFARKERDALEEFPAVTNTQDESVCGICRRLPAMCEVTRLRISSRTPTGFVEVRLPYCGQC